MISPSLLKLMLKERNIISCNQNMLEMVNWKRKDVKGKKLGDIIKPGALAEILCSGTETKNGNFTTLSSQQGEKHIFWKTVAMTNKKGISEKITINFTPLENGKN